MNERQMLRNFVWVTPENTRDLLNRNLINNYVRQNCLDWQTLRSFALLSFDVYSRRMY
jgi:hypothetical protein